MRKTTGNHGLDRAAGQRERVDGGGVFPDHFSGHATDYARHRPGYPEDLFRYLSALAPRRRRAWDCGTGSGQAAIALAGHFDLVIATDASARQIESAVPQPRIVYRVAHAEASGLDERSVDLVTVAQALHWFDRGPFWAEVRRVLAPDGIVAVWCYGLLSVSAEVDAVVQHLYRDIVGPFWPPERAVVERGYASIEFPFVEEIPPGFRMEKRWTLSNFVGFLRTWSATRRFMEETGADPVARIEKALARAWGDPAAHRRASWDLDLRVGRNLRQSSR